MWCGLIFILLSKAANLLHNLHQCIQYRAVRNVFMNNAYTVGTRGIIKLICIKAISVVLFVILHRYKHYNRFAPLPLPLGRIIT